MPIVANWDNNYMDDCTPNFNDNMTLPRHRWYEFKEGFGSSLVKRAIEETHFKTKKKRLHVLDPFSGSGTTPLTALQNNCDSTGIEVNPFMSFVGAAKSKPKQKSHDVLLKEITWLMHQKPFEIESPLENISSFSPSGGRNKWLFNSSVIRGYEALKTHISKIEDNELYQLALFSSVMQCCNAKKDGKCLRYKKNWDTFGYSSKELRNLFYTNCVQILNDLNIVPLIDGDRTFLEGDTRLLLSKVHARSVDLIVFSPPYLNSFDYSDIYRPELFLGDFVCNNAELRTIRKKTLRSHVQNKITVCDKPQSTWANMVADQVRDQKRNLWNQDIPDMINAYFYDMEKVFAETYRVARKGCQMWFVVATSAYSGIEIPVDLILADIAVKKGWNLNNVNALRKLRTSSQCSSDDIRKIRLRESLVICQK